jgi:hypothetical protein
MTDAKQLTDPQKKILENWMNECIQHVEVEPDSEDGLYDARLPALDHFWGFRSIKETKNEAVNDLINIYHQKAIQLLLSGDTLPMFVVNHHVDYDQCCDLAQNEQIQEDHLNLS